MREFFQLLVLGFMSQSCATEMAAVMDFGRDECGVHYSGIGNNFEFHLGTDFMKNYHENLPALSLDRLEYMNQVMRDPQKNAYIDSLSTCNNEKSSKFSIKHKEFLAELDKVLTDKRAEDKARKERREKIMSAEAEEERQRQAKEAEDYKKACDTEKRYAKQHGLKPTCGTSVSELVYALVQNHAKESEVKKSIVYIGNSDWTDEQSIQALPDMALFSVDSGRFTLMIKAKGLIQGQTLNDVGKMLVFEGITNYQANFGPRQAFVFSILNPK